MKKSALLVSTVLGIALAASSALAAKSHETGTVKGVVNAPVAVPAAHKMKSSVSNWGYYDTTSYSYTGTPLDTETVKCSSKTTCTFEMSFMVQQCSFDGEYSANLYAVWVLVDGNFVDDGPYAGGTNTSHPCDIQNWQGLYSGLVPGSHTVEYEAYEGPHAYIAEWADRTDVGTP